MILSAGCGADQVDGGLLVAVAGVTSTCVGFLEVCCFTHFAAAFRGTDSVRAAHAVQPSCNTSAAPSVLAPAC